MKKIVYLIVDNGIEGRDPDNIVRAFWDEQQRDSSFDGDKNKNWYRKTEIIVDEERSKKEALTKLNGLDKLVLGLENKLNVTRK